LFYFFLIELEWKWGCVWWGRGVFGVEIVVEAGEPAKGYFTLVSMGNIG